MEDPGRPALLLEAVLQDLRAEGRPNPETGSDTLALLSRLG
jgi:hypothetical protein